MNNVFGQHATARRSTFPYLAIAVWSRMFVPSIANFIEAPHSATIAGVAAARTPLSGSLSVITTITLIAMCIICISFPSGIESDRSPGYRVGICLGAPVLVFLQSAYAGSATVNTSVDLALTVVVCLALRASAPSLSDVKIVGYLGGLTCVASLGIAALLPTHAVFVDQYGYTSSTKAFLISQQIAGIVGHSNTLGMIGVLSMSLLLGGRRTLFRYGLLFASSAAILLSASRSSLIAVGALFVSGATAIIIRHHGKELAALLLIPVAVMSILPLTVSSSDAFTGRGRIWVGSLDAASRSWLVGLGGNWYRRILDTSQALGSEAVSGHNMLVHAFTTAGLIGIIIFGVLLGAVGFSIAGTVDNDRSMIRRVFVVICTIGTFEWAWGFDAGGDLFLMTWFLSSSIVMARPSRSDVGRPHRQAAVKAKHRLAVF